MIASCWDWPSLKYGYYILEGVSLDAGGWGPSRGIHREDTETQSSGPISFDDCLPSLPQDAKFVGVGDFCIGELFSKRDATPRLQITIDAIASRQNPESAKVVQLLKDRNVNENLSLRSNPEGSEDNKKYSTVVERIVPLVASLGSGYFMYRTFQGLAQSSLSFKDVLIAWGTGVAIGVAIGQESSRHSAIRQELKK